MNSYQSKLVVSAIELVVEAAKHLGGQHNQQSHGSGRRAPKRLPTAGTAKTGHKEFNAESKAALEAESDGNTTLNEDGKVTGMAGGVEAALRDKTAQEIAANIPPGSLDRLEAAYRDSHLGMLPKDIGGMSKEAWVVAKLIDEWNFGYKNSHWYQGMKEAVRRKTVKDARESVVNDTVKQDRDKMLDEVGEELDIVVRSIYRHTQNRLKEMGVDEITVYRGMELPSIKKTGAVETEVHLNGLSSTSISIKKSRDFAGYGDNSAIVALSVKREEIFSIPTTGAGTYMESEVVVFGGKKKGVMLVGLQSDKFHWDKSNDELLNNFYEEVDSRKETKAKKPKETVPETIYPDDDDPDWLRKVRKPK